ncbi:MAG TPA: 5-formyltetrahydrofolate cyclo-ligase [Candidatus Latescibacteria bacterium]|nr:5-formyltetrahydrofolate cyclo-ligase [Candidatus Latescibacterota bacterium]
MEPDIRTAKKALRVSLKALREAFSEAECEESSHRIFTLLLTLPEWQNARTVHIYIGALPGEVRTLPIIRWCWDEGRNVIVPVVGKDGDMGHVFLAPATALATTRWGGLEPRDAEPADSLTADVVIVPGVAFDRSGNRLGMGGGFYDRFLSTVTTPKIALAHAFQIVDAVPVNSHDRRVDLIVTPDEVIRA